MARGIPSSRRQISATHGPFWGVRAKLGAAALAFGLGAHNTVSNIIAAHYVRKAYRVGDSVRIGKQQGRIIEITQIAVLLDTDEGRVMVPTRQFNEEVSVLLPSGD